MTSAQLLARLDKLNHHQRWQELLSLTKKSKPEHLSDLQSELETDGDWQQQLVSLQISILTRNEDGLFRSLESQSRTVRDTASHSLTKFCRDENRFAAYLQQAPTSIRKRLLKTIGRSNPSKFADELLSKVEPFGLKSVAYLLPACSQKLVSQNLKRCEPHIGSWRRLAARHPKLVLEFISEQFEKSNQYTRRRLWQQFSDCFEPIEKTNLQQLYQLVTDYCENFADLPCCIQQCIVRQYRQHPERCATIIFSQNAMKSYKQSLPMAIISQAEKFSDSHLQILVDELLPKPNPLVPVIHRLGWERRRKLIEAALNSGVQCGWTPEFLQRMPWEIRSRQADKILNGKKQLQSAARLQHLELLLLEDALPELEQEFKTTRPENRAAGYTALIRCGAINNQMNQVIEVLTRSKNDQDPVRQAIFTALAQVPPSRFHAENLEAIENLIEAAVQAPDISAMTLQAASQLLLRLLGVSSSKPAMKRVLAMMVRVAKELKGNLFGTYYLGGYYGMSNPLQNLSHGLEHDLVDAVSDVLETQNKLGGYSATHGLANFLGQRGWKVPRLQELLQQSLDAHHEDTRLQGINIWLLNPLTRNERIEKLIAKDPSVITVHSVMAHLHRRRQDLLDPFLGESPIAGKFLSGKRLYLLEVEKGFQRWLPRQQRAFAKRLDQWTRQKGTGAVGLRWGMRVRAALQITTLDDFAKTACQRGTGPIGISSGGVAASGPD